MGPPPVSRRPDRREPQVEGLEARAVPVERVAGISST